MIKDRLSKIKDLFRSKHIAYNQSLNKQTLYGQIVLEDLAKFCKANEATFHKDLRVSAMLDGRRQVWLRIQQYLELTPDELFKLHHIKNNGGE